MVYQSGGLQGWRCGFAHFLTSYPVYLVEKCAIQLFDAICCNSSWDHSCNARCVVFRTYRHLIEGHCATCGLKTCGFRFQARVQVVYAFGVCLYNRVFMLLKNRIKKRVVFGATATLHFLLTYLACSYLIALGCVFTDSACLEKRNLYTLILDPPWNRWLANALRFVSRSSWQWETRG